MAVSFYTITSSKMPRNVLQTLTIVALVVAIFFVAHNFVRYVLRGKCSFCVSVFFKDLYVSDLFCDWFSWKA